MSQLSRFVALCAVVSLSACSGSNQQVIDNLNRARKDASPDAEEAAAAEDDWDSETPSAGEDAASTDAGSVEAGSVDAPGDAALGNGDAASLVGDATSMDAATDANGNGEDATSLDAGPPDAADGAFDANAPDAAALDAGDASAAADTGSDAAVQGLRITLTRGGAPVPHASVFFHGVEDELVATAETNGAGRAQTDLTVYKVTVLLPLVSQNFSAQLFTYFNVQPGDDLKLELPPEPLRQDSYVVALPSNQGERFDVGGGLYGCARGSNIDASEISVSNQPGCLAPTGNTLLVSQWNQTVNGEYYPVSYGRVSGLAAPAPSAAPTRLGVDDYSDSLSPGRDVHLGLNGVTVDLNLQTGLWAFWGEQGAALGFKGGTEYLTSNGSIEYVAPSFAFDAFLSTGYYYADQVNHRLQVRSASSQAPSALELSRALPSISNFAMYDGTGNAPHVYWTSEPASARDAFLFETVVRIRDVDGGRIFDAVWAGVTDDMASSVRLPPIPADLLPVLSPSWTLRWEAARMSEVRSTQIDDYDAFRQQILRYLPGGGDLVELRLSEPGEAEVVTWDHRS
jgi:hypothetical protein